MNIVILILLTAAEIILAAISISRKINVKDYAKLRIAANAVELLVSLLAVITKQGSLKLRFGGLFLLLSIRVVIAGIIWLINHKKKAGKKTSAIIVSVVFSIMFFISSLVPAFVFANYNGLKTSGEYEVKTAGAILKDESRIEAFEDDGSCREVPLYFYYPDVGEDEAQKEFPIVFFSHGAFGYYQSNTSTYMELASRGYVVISVEHPYHSFFTKDTDGKTVIVDLEFISTAVEVQNSDELSSEENYEITEEWIKLRLEDMNFVIDEVKLAVSEGSIDDSWYCENIEEITDVLELSDVNTIGVMGHSLGGAAAVTLGRDRDDIDAVIDIDGTMLGEIDGVLNGVDIVSEEPYEVPMLVFDNEDHHNDRTQAASENILYVNNVILTNATTCYETCISGSGHMNYTDLPLFSPFLAGLLGVGEVDSEQCISKMNEITADFLDCYLKGEGTFAVEEIYELP